MSNPKAKKVISDRRDDAKTEFRGKLGPRRYSVMKNDPNFDHRWVVTTYDSNVDAYERVEQFIDKGYAVVYDTSKPTDERSMAADNNNEDSDRKRPITKKLKNGHIAVLMKISKKQKELNEINKARRDDQRKLAMIKRQSKSGSAITNDLDDVNLESSEAEDAVNDLNDE